jgi:hypothetical protein
MFFEEPPCLTLVLLSECYGQKDEKPHAKKIKLPRYWIFLRYICRSLMVKGEIMRFNDYGKKSIKHQRVSRS